IRLNYQQNLRDDCKNFSLVAFGELAVEPVARLIKHPDNRVRSAAVLTLNRILEASPHFTNNMPLIDIIRDVLMQASTDEYPFVRIRAIDGLVQLKDPEAIDLIEQMAQNDPYRAEYRPGMPYLVREAAMDALRSLGAR
ncbi:MAG: HEAT repeat domain-containing protein, partial [Pseudomonadales bacterium]|nr:HEAT repeat domain-containing protein [Pseudomonadales bacterium]